MSRSPAPRPCSTRHAVILAAGESKRTRPLTSYRPKPLIPLLGRPLLALILDELFGLIERATLVVGYRAEEIRAAFGESYRGIELRYVLQEQADGTAGALRAVGRIEEPFFLLYGDNLIAHEDVVGVCGALPGLAGMRVEDARSFGVLQIVGDRVLGIVEKPLDPPPGALANPGIYHLDQAAFPALGKIAPSPRGEYELTDLIGLLAADRPVGYHICAGYWVPVGTPWEALSAAQFLLARRAALHNQQSYIGEGCAIAAGCTVEASCVEAGATIGEGALVRNSVIGAGARVGAGCLVESSWLDEGAQLGEGAQLQAQLFDELRPTADTGGLLSRELLCTRGAVIGRGVFVAAGDQVEPGSVVTR